MEPVLRGYPLPGVQVIVARDQKPYKQLPGVYTGPYKDLHTKWKLSWAERFTIFLGGHVYMVLRTFGHPVTPSKLSASETLND